MNIVTVFIPIFIAKRRFSYTFDPKKRSFSSLSFVETCLALEGGSESDTSDYRQNSISKESRKEDNEPVAVHPDGRFTPAHYRAPSLSMESGYCAFFKVP